MCVCVFLCSQGMHQNHKKEIIATFHKKFNSNAIVIIREAKIIKQVSDIFEKTFRDLKLKINEALEACEDYYLNQIESLRIFKSEEDINRLINTMSILNNKMPIDQESLQQAINITRSPSILTQIYEDERKKKEKLIKKFTQEVQDLKKNVQDFIKNSIENLLPKPHVYEFFKLDQFKGVTKQLQGHSDQIFSISQLNDKLLITGGYDKKIILWNFQNNQQLAHFNGHKGYVSALCKFSNKEFLSGSGGDDNTIRLWNWQVLPPLLREPDNDLKTGAGRWNK